ncbi:MAG TPA: PD-(D/E)XK nuclease family protein [Cyclobacteriaceae bacterium]|nr:PD-(D/E)XK nuclease family protein [Cyclobacteriaceae bacterium]
MKQFLYELAEQIKKDHPAWENLTVVFPNRRAVLYFRHHLSQLLEKPAFAPQLITIEELFARHSQVRVPDKLELVHRLYHIYGEVMKRTTTETFDQFYFWGEMLLRDFDEMDKYLVSAEQVFRDLSNQKEMDAAFEYLTEQQIEFLESFWGPFQANLTSNKKKFLDTWRHLPAVYREFRNSLSAENLAYDGMLQRTVAEGPLDQLVSGPVVFAGFNALTSAEEKLMTAYLTKGTGQVHWDVDSYYLNDMAQEAGVFFRQYQMHAVLGKTFPKDIPGNFSRPKNVSILGASQLVGQAKLMAQTVGELLAKGMIPEETLIVLPDEKMLLPVLHGLAVEVKTMNVTMGFPLASTPVFNLIEQLAELQVNQRESRFNQRHVLALLGHPYVLAADPVLASGRRKEIVENKKFTVPAEEMQIGPLLFGVIFQPISGQSIIGYLHDIMYALGGLPQLTALDKEYVLQFLKLINRLGEVWTVEEAAYNEFPPAKKEKEIWKSFLRLFRQLVRAQKIPFVGEPLSGLQVMGVLETRNLDFKNVFILSMNEGALPAGGHRSSYVPFTIRKAYQLPTTEHQDAMYAYLFYRILQRAENVYLFYNTETDVLGQGEKSRFLQQLLFESGWNIKHRVLQTAVQPTPLRAIEIPKDEFALQGLERLNEVTDSSKGISPSALNTYVQCSLRFYFRYIARIKELEEVDDDINARSFGLLLHHVMQKFYEGVVATNKNKIIEPSDLNHAETVIDKLINEYFIHLSGTKGEVVYEGQRLIVREVVMSFAEAILRHDKAYAPFTIEGLEKGGLTYYAKISHAPGQAVLSGTIDRLDLKDNVLRVIDYKTGGDKLEFSSIESLFDGEDKSRNKAVFQTFLYALLYRANHPVNGLQLIPGLLTRANLFEEELHFGFSMNKKPIGDMTPFVEQFESLLKRLLEELFNPEIPFRQTRNEKNCEYCPYRQICYRN